MKRRYRYLLNFFSFCLLLFALYLNFVKKETDDVLTADKVNQQGTGTLQKEITKTASLNQQIIPLVSK
ncbi:MAG: hypothetical protein M3Y85_07305 [Bacteroidota bacterium]|nr:hypothetical protein [Bacteroidota bacterium]